MGLRLLVDLSHALGVKVDTGRPTRLVEADLPTIIQTFEGSELKLRLTPAASLAPVSLLVKRYDVYLSALSDWLVIPLPVWVPSRDTSQDTLAGDDVIGWID